MSKTRKVFLHVICIFFFFCMSHSAISVRQFTTSSEYLQQIFSCDNDVYSLGLLFNYTKLICYERQISKTHKFSLHVNCNFFIFLCFSCLIAQYYFDSLHLVQNNFNSAIMTLILQDFYLTIQNQSVTKGKYQKLINFPNTYSAIFFL